MPRALGRGDYTRDESSTLPRDGTRPAAPEAVTIRYRPGVVIVFNDRVVPVAEEGFMKDLLIIRHAKSSWDHPGLADHERPLSPRGEKAAPAMGHRLRRRALVPARLVVSPAVRAQQTAESLATAMGLDADAIVTDPRAYEADAEDWLDIIQELPDELQRVGIVGHNPALHELAAHLVDLRVDKFPTAAVVHAGFDVDRWRDVARDTGSCVDFDYPKSGRDAD